MLGFLPGPIQPRFAQDLEQYVFLFHLTGLPQIGHGFLTYLFLRGKKEQLQDLEQVFCFVPIGLNIFPQTGQGSSGFSLDF